MRRTLGVLLLLALTACGQSGGSASPSASDTPTSPSSVPSSASSSPAPSPTPVDGWDQVAILTASGAGGRVSPVAVRLDGPASVQAFAGQFRSPALAHRITTALRRTDLASGQVLVGAVVALGCGVPDSVTVSAIGHRLLVQAGPIKNSPPECLVAMTSVALVSVPAEVAPPAAGQ